MQLQLGLAIVARSPQLRELELPDDATVRALVQRESRLPVQGQATAALARCRHPKRLALHKSSEIPLVITHCPPLSHSAHPQLNHTGHNGRVPAVLDAQQLLPRFHAQILWLVAGVLQQETVLARVDRLRLLDHAEHRLVHLVRHIGLGQGGHIQLEINVPALLTNNFKFKKIPTHWRRFEEQHFGALQHEKPGPVALPI